MRAPFRAESRAAARRERLPVAIAYALVLAVLSAAISPELAHVADDRALNEVATNGYYAFWEALRGRGTSYGALYATRRSELLLPRLHTLLADRSAPVSVFASQSTTRRVSTSRPARRLNVVVILEESLGSQFIGALHPGTPSLTPEIDALAARGTLLTNAYSTGNRTIRALEATTSSLPPLPGISVVRRPESVNLFTLPAVLRERGYATEFVYGGRAMFDGMGAYLRNNGVDHVIEQRDYPRAEFTTAWGVSDEAIFTKALASMDSLHGAGRPFYSLILTVSNHRPYTYPAGRVAADPNERKRVNVVRYADWALGRFMKEAARRPFFDRTVFVIMGDHGPRVYGAAEIPLASYAVPVLFYAPGIVPAARVGTLASSMDIPPTVLGLLGGRYESKFFGRDVLGGARGSTRGLAVMTHNNEVALMRDGRLAVLGLRGATALYAVDPSSGALQRVGSPDSSGRAMIEDAIAYFETADELYRRGDYRFERPADVVALAHGSSGTATPPRRDGPTTAVGATH